MNAVWIVNHYAIDPRESNSGSRHFSLARRLAELGWSPVIFAASTDHPSGRQRADARQGISERSREGVLFRYLRSPQYTNGFTRVINMLCFSLQLLSPAAVRGLPRPQVIIGSTVHPMAAWAASILARRLAVPFVFEIRDLWPQTLIDMGKFGEQSVPARLMRLLERSLCNRSAGIITLLPFAHEYLARQGVPAEKVFWISNGTDLDEFLNSPPAHNKSFIVKYLGSIGKANGVGTILQSFIAAAERDPHMHLEIIGDGPERSELEKVASQTQHGDRVTFRDPVVKRAVPQAISNADALVINILDLDVYRYGVSMNKLFDYAAAGRPIVLASNARNNLVAEANAGITVPADDAGALCDALVSMAKSDNAAQRAQWGANARTHVAAHYDYRILGNRLHQLLRDVVEQKDNK